MRVGIDARWIFPEISGIGAHTRELLRHLALVDRDTDYRVYFRDPALRAKTWADAGLTDKPNFTSAMIPWGIFSPLGQVLMPTRLRRDGIDVYHSTNYMMPLAAFPRNRPHDIRCVVTIHDLIPLLFPEATPRALKTRLFPLYRRLMLEIGARADRIIAVSHASRSDILRCLRLPPSAHNRVRVVYNGVASSCVPPPAPRSAPPASPAASERTILYVGRADPYKNLTKLVEAFAALRTSTNAPLLLRIVGPPDPRYPEPGERSRQLGVNRFVEWTGYLNSDGLIQAYQQADVVVLPSRYEGFGFPVVEAMACGTPVLCNDIPVLREVGGDAALYANAEDPAGFASALRRLLDDPTLRTTLVAGGKVRAASFSWLEAARQTVAIYRESGSDPALRREATP